MKKYLLILVGLCFFLSEIILSVNPVLGFISYSVLIAGCLIALSKEESLDDYGKLLIVLMILPIIRIAELFIGLDYGWRTFIIYYLLTFLVVFYSTKFKINPGYRKKGLGFLPVAIVVGAVLGIAGKGLFNLSQYPVLFLLLPVVAFSEEILFRGLTQNLVNKKFGFFASMLFTSLIYAIFSLGFGITAALFMFGVSMITCLTYHFNKNIFVVISINFMVHLFLLIS